MAIDELLISGALLVCVIEFHAINSNREAADEAENTQSPVLPTPFVLAIALSGQVLK